MEALHDAIKTKDEKRALAIWIGIGACTEDEGRTLLQAATSAGMERLVCALVGKGEDVNASDIAGTTPLMEAARSGVVGVMEALVGMGADMEAADSEHGMRALHHALACKQEAAALFLLQRDPPCDVNARDTHGNTPLMYAVMKGMVAVMEVLLTMGAEFAAAGEHRAHHVLDEQDTAAQDAAALFLLQRATLDVNARHGHGETLLMDAARCGLLSVMEALLAMDADVEAADSEHGMKAIHHALYYEQEAAALFLLQRDPPCDVNARDTHGNTALMYGAATGMVGAMEALVAMGADVEAADRNGKRALQHALLCKQQDSVKHLLEAGADPTTTTPCQISDQVKNLLCRAIAEPDRVRVLFKARFLLDAAETMRNASDMDETPGVKRQKTIAKAPDALKCRLEQGDALPRVELAQPSENQLLETATFSGDVEERMHHYERLRATAAFAVGIGGNCLSSHVFMDLLEYMMPEWGDKGRDVKESGLWFSM